MATSVASTSRSRRIEAMANSLSDAVDDAALGTDTAREEDLRPLVSTVASTSWCPDHSEVRGHLGDLLDIVRDRRSRRSSFWCTAGGGGSGVPLFIEFASTLHLTRIELRTRGVSSMSVATCMRIADGWRHVSGRGSDRSVGGGPTITCESATANVGDGTSQQLSVAVGRRVRYVRLLLFASDSFCVVLGGCNGIGLIGVEQGRHRRSDARTQALTPDD